MTLSVTIHLVVRYREIAKNNPDTDNGELTRQTLEQMIRPCIYTTLTTIAAFISLTLSNIRPVIDFGLMGIGDPAVDCLPAWSLFDAHSRSVFKETLKVDDHTWERGKGWALSIALIILPFYRNRNQVLVDVAKRMINELVLEK